MRRYIESALRFRIRLIISALLVFGLALAGLSIPKAGFTSTSTVWVEKPQYIPDPSNVNQYISAATLQSGILVQLLGTRQFTLDIAEQAGIPIHTASEEASVIQDLQKNLVVDAAGSNLIRLSFTGSKPDYPQQVISETIKAFVTWQNATRTTQANAALDIYKKQIAAYSQQMNSSKAALDNYLRDHPGAGTGISTIDPTLTDLQQQYNDDRTRYSDVQAKIDQINTQAQSGSAIDTAFFRVIDQPGKPEPYKSSMKDLLKNGLIALVMGLLTIVGITLVGTWTDSAVYTLNDVTSLGLVDAEGNAREMLVGILPSVPALAALRRRDAKLSKGRNQRGATGSAAQVPRPAATPEPTR